MKEMTVKSALLKNENKIVKKFLDLWIGEEETPLHIDKCTEIFNTKTNFPWETMKHLYSTSFILGSLDWKADDDEFISEMDSVLSEADLNFDDYDLDITCDDEAGVYEWLELTQYVINKDGYSLINIDTNSDQYTFTIVKKEKEIEFVTTFNSLAKLTKCFTSASQISPVKQLVDNDDDCDDCDDYDDCDDFDEVIKTVNESETTDTTKTTDNTNKIVFTSKFDEFTNKNTCFFGEYPQTLVEDDELIAKLDELSKDNEEGIYEIDNIRYAKSIIKVNKSTLKHTFYSSFFENGIMAFDGETAYFKFEPLEWIIIDDNNEQARLLCTKGIDKSIVDESEENREVKNIPYDYSYYEHSKLRKFLNNDFYFLSFTDDEKELITTMIIDNSPNSTTSYAMGNSFDFKNTEDKVHTLSYKEAKNTKWGFESGEYSYSNLRIIKSTDYAFSKGLTKSLNHTVSWCLRSPKTYASSKGQTIAREERDSTTMAARPVICLDKSKVIIK